MSVRPAPPRQARERCGLTLAQAARRLGVSPAYLRQMERRVGWSWALAQRAARVYGVPLDLFIYRVSPERCERLLSTVTGGLGRGGGVLKPRGSHAPRAGGVGTG